MAKKKEKEKDATTPKNSLAPVQPDNDWEAEDNLRTLERAEMLKKDAKKMEAVHKLAGRKVQALHAIRSVKDLEQVYDDKFGKGAGKKPGTLK